MAGASGGEQRQSYAAIAAVNKSKRDDKNVIEVKLVKAVKTAKFKLTNEDIMKLVCNLSMKPDEFTELAACPEGRPVVYITLADHVDVKRFGLTPKVCQLIKSCCATKNNLM